MQTLYRVAALAVLVALGASALTQRASAQTATVSTVAQLRSAVTNPIITTININPGTYLLTSSGSGQLLVERSVTITNTGGGRVVIDGNNASRIFYINNGTVTMTGLTLTRGNGGGSEGAAIYVNSGTLRLIRSTVSGNATINSKQGGGIWSNSSTLELINSTVSGNTASGSQGGGVFVNGGSLLVSNSTVANNSATGGGGIYRNTAGVTLRNAIVADNTGGQIAGTGLITSNGKNVVEGGCTGCSALDLTADPVLGALADNGGTSYTHALLAGSPALNAASNTDAEATDQRGVTRPQGTTADMGAFESGADLGVTKTVSDPTPAEGDAISYTVTVSAAGPDGATSVTVSDLLPAGVTLQSATTTQGSYSSGTGVWTLGTMPSGASATLTFNVTVNSGTAGATITNTAAVTGLIQGESNPANNSASVSITVRVLVVVTPDGGQNLQHLPSSSVTHTFTFTVQNLQDFADGFDLLASSPGSVAISIVSVNGVAGDSTRLTSLATGASQTINVVYAVGDVPGGTRDTLFLRARSVTQPAIADNGWADLTVIRPSLTVTKLAFRDDQVTPVGTGTVTLGEYVQYRVTVTNTGAAAATSVHVEETISALQTFVAVTGDAAGWTFTNTGSQVGADLAGTLAAGASRFFWVRVQVN